MSSVFVCRLFAVRGSSCLFESAIAWVRYNRSHRLSRASGMISFRLLRRAQ